MRHDCLPGAETNSLSTSLVVLVTKHAMKIISDPETAPGAKRAVERAIGFASGVEFTEPRTVMIEGCPLGVHVDPRRRVVIILARFPGWPAVTDDLVTELLPLSTSVALA